MDKSASAIVDRLTSAGFVNSAQIAAFIGAKGLWEGGPGPDLPLGPLIVVTVESSRPDWAVNNANEAMARMCAAAADPAKQQTLEWTLAPLAPPAKQGMFGRAKSIPARVLATGTITGWVFPYYDTDKRPSSRVIVVGATGDAIDVPAPESTEAGRRFISLLEYPDGDQKQAQPFRDFGGPRRQYADAKIIAQGSCTLLGVPLDWSQ